jgi:lysophospholipase L1-like esterase
MMACRRGWWWLGPSAVALAIAAAGAASAQAPQAVPIRASKIILVGDSTTAVWGGWGPSFCAHHVTSFAACLNLARGGRSSGSYRAEGSWDIARGEMRVPGYRDIWVLIQFGHNDQPGKPGRSTDLRTEFPVNMRRYVEEVRAAGAHPVLVTPLTRRIFKEGRLDNDLEPWAAVIRKVAAELDVPLVDLNAESAAAVRAMGAPAANRLAAVPDAVIVPPADTAEANDQLNGPPKQAFDYTHLGTAGADYFATLVTRALARAVPAMRPLLVR